MSKEKEGQEGRAILASTERDDLTSRLEEFSLIAGIPLDGGGT